MPLTETGRRPGTDCRSFPLRRGVSLRDRALAGAGAACRGSAHSGCDPFCNRIAAVKPLFFFG